MKKILIFLCIVTIGCVYGNLDESLKQHFEECLTETGASREEAQKLLKHDFSSDDAKVKCFPKCFCTKAGACDSSLNMVASKIEEHMPDEMKPKVDAATAKCSSVTGSDECDTLFHKFKCFFNEVHM